MTGATLGVGFTKYVNVVVLPAQPADDDGVTTILAVTCTVLVFTAVNAGILPEPVAARPMVLLLFVLKR